MVSVASTLHRVKRAVVPISRHMAVDSIIDRLTGYAEPEIPALSRLIAGRRTALDIGANCGSYTFALSRLFQSVWAFEPNQEICRPISAARIANVRLEPVALSSRAGRAMLKRPVVNGQVLDGWATLEKNNLSTTSISTEVEIFSLDSYGLEDVDFIKLDVEGHELEVLIGASKTITSCRPICLIEANDEQQIAEFFKPLRYSIHRKWNDISLSPQNVLLVPMAA